MAEIFTVTAPLFIREGDHEILIAECFPYEKGLLYFDLYWYLGQPDDVFHVIEGEINGDGPWKIGSSVINVLGCQGSQPELAAEWAKWQAYIQSPANEYPPDGLIQAIARKAGAILL